MTRHFMVHNGTAIVRDPDVYEDVVDPKTGETRRELQTKGKEHKIKLAPGSRFGNANVGTPVDVTDMSAAEKKALADKGYEDLKGDKRKKAEKDEPEPTGLSPEMAKVAEEMREKALGDAASLPGGPDATGGKE